MVAKRVQHVGSVWPGLYILEESSIVTEYMHRLVVSHGFNKLHIGESLWKKITSKYCRGTVNCSKEFEPDVLNTFCGTRP